MHNLASLCSVYYYHYYCEVYICADVAVWPVHMLMKSLWVYMREDAVLQSEDPNASVPSAGWASLRSFTILVVLRMLAGKKTISSQCGQS